MSRPSKPKSTIVTDVYTLTASFLEVTEGTSLAVGHVGTAAVPVQVQLCNPVIRQSVTPDLYWQTMVTTPSSNSQPHLTCTNNDNITVNFISVKVGIHAIGKSVSQCCISSNHHWHSTSVTRQLANRSVFFVPTFRIKLRCLLSCAKDTSHEYDSYTKLLFLANVYIIRLSAGILNAK